MFEIDTIPKQETQPPPHHGLFGHPLLSIFAVIVLLLGAGFLIVDRRAQRLPSNQGGGWDNINSLLSGDSAPIAPQPQLSHEAPVYSDNDYKLPTLTPDGSDASKPQQSGQNDFLDYGSVLSSIQGSGLRTIRTTLPSGSKIDLTYEFMPAGLVSSSSAPANLDYYQQPLYDYANIVGSYIQTFEQRHTSQTQILKDQIEDRADPAKNDAVRQLGNALQTVGKNIAEIQDVPEKAVSLNAALAASYQEIGSNLTLVPDAKTTSDLLKAINTYNASANRFAKNFIAMVELFNSNGIRFGQDDPGSVFSFTGQGGQ